MQRRKSLEKKLLSLKKNRRKGKARYRSFTGSRKKACPEKVFPFHKR